MSPRFTQGVVTSAASWYIFFRLFIPCFHKERTSFNPVIKYGEAGKTGLFKKKYLLTLDWDDAFNMYGCLG